MDEEPAVMRIVTGTFSHETNTFSNIPTTMEEFAKQGITHGEDIPHRFRGTNAIEAAFMDAAEKHGFELIWTIYGSAIPGGKVSQEAYEYFSGHLLEGIQAAGAIDGVLLHLHGAMVTEQVDDGEGHLLEAVRRLVGPDMPIVTTLDLHANLTPRMIQNCNALTGYDTYPHIDMYERAFEAAEILVRIIRGEIRPVMALERPLLITPLQTQVTTRDTPMKRIIDLVHSLEEDRCVISIAAFGGFPFADIEPAGFSCVVVTDADAGLAGQLAKQVTDAAVAERENWIVHPTPPQEAVRRAMAAQRGPVILADIADSGAGGTAGDATVTFKTLLDLGARNAAVCSISDQEAIDICLAAGVGAEVSMLVGGKRDKLHGDPVPVTGTVRLIHQGSFVREGPIGRGVVQTVGRCVVLEIGGRDGIELMLTEHRAHPNDLQYFRAFGIEPTRRQMLVLKSAAHYRAAFDPIATETIEVDAPGITSPRLERYPYQNIRRPIYPLDDV
jgi:microcystin degradation protein MlrC